MPRPTAEVEYDFQESTVPVAPNPFTNAVRTLAKSDKPNAAFTFKVPLDPKTELPVKQATIASQLSKAGNVVGVQVRRSWKDYPEKVTIWTVELADADEDEDEEDDE